MTAESICVIIIVFSEFWGRTNLPPAATWSVFRLKPAEIPESFSLCCDWHLHLFSQTFLTLLIGSEVTVSHSCKRATLPQKKKKTLPGKTQELKERAVVLDEAS